MRIHFSLLTDAASVLAVYVVATGFVLAWMHLPGQRVVEKGSVAASRVARRMAIVFGLLFVTCWLLGMAAWVFFLGFVALSIFSGIVGGILNVWTAGAFGMSYIVLQYVLGFPDHDKWILSPQPPRPRPPSPASELDRLVGQQGQTLSALRPGGEVALEGSRFPAASNGSQFIEANATVDVIAVRNGKLIVGRSAADERDD